MIRLLLLLPLLSSSGVSATCYYPNSQVSPDSPCDPGDPNASGPCCGGSTGSKCLSNKLCESPDGNIIRGSCTDRNWGSGCPLFCLSQATGGTDLISCANVTHSDTSYCCDHTDNCCDTGVGRFNVLPSSPTTSATWNAAASQFVVLKPSSSLSTLSSSLSSSETLPSSSSSSVASSSLVTSSSSSSSSSPLSSTTGDAPVAGNSQPSGAANGLSAGAAVGIGVGAGLSVILAAAVVRFVLRHSKRKAEARNNGGAVVSLTPEQSQPSLGDANPAHLSTKYYYSGRPAYPLELPGNSRVLEMPSQ